MDKVSVIVPVFNPQRTFFEEALASICSQSHGNIEVLVINDGSSDRSFLPVIEKHLPEIKYYEQDNRGVAGARNTGLEKATGEYIGFLDQDDRWHSDKLQRQLALFATDPSVDVVFHPVNFIDREGEPQRKKRGYKRKICSLTERGDILPELLKGNFIYSPTVLARKECFEKVGPFDSTVEPHDDWDMWIRLVLAGFTFKVLDDPLADWRIHTGNTSKDRRLMLRTNMAVMQKLLSKEILPIHYRKYARKRIVESEILAAHNYYSEGKYRDYRKTVREIAGSHWTSVLRLKIFRRLCKSIVLERLGNRN